MTPKVSVVINTLDAEKSITRAIKSVDWADEVLICDMYSQDKTVEIAKKMGVKIVYHKKVLYVEPARNFAISKASNDWVLILDPDEEVSADLAKKLIKIASSYDNIDYVRVPRKNIVFNKWMKASMWWPDYNIRFFKKGKVVWTDEIHRPPQAEGMRFDIPAEEQLAIVHHNYQNISQFVLRMNRYTTIEAELLLKQNYQFKWTDLIEKPLSEFLSRFFANKGYQDGVHGLSLSMLQSFSFLVVYLKIWEKSSFKEETVDLSDLEIEKNKAGYQLGFWLKESKKPKNPFKRFLYKLNF